MADIAAGIRNCTRHWLLKLKLLICRQVYSMDVSPTARISVGALLDKAKPRGVHIGDES